ncbi:hypothetical protein Lesp02_60680 [Lentzea sp. NBRC 105346]|uniref:hypothetical protein n=1 Tax=Lentzea sp. NBRC 105346 TaxID=3032205 RepID=UPI002555738F|nr:hypothetical protein [Lentzea sp. NBRC 105346]GLZ33880.1 hypothetical protein Lesp02_60680 [Lentzea sp. NBRC 105346]
MGTSRWLVPAVVVITGAALGTGLVVRELYQRPPEAKGSPIVQTTPSVSPADLPGDGEVRLSVDAFAHPDSQRVQAVLQHYFDAINEHDYDKWRSTVTKERRKTSRDQFLSGYSTTRDGSIVVQRIESDASADRVRVLMNLVSTQDPSKGPPDMQEGCIRWRVVYPLVWEDQELRLDLGAEVGLPQRERC